MLELTENTFQVLVLCACVGVSLYRSIKFVDKTSIILLFLFGGYLLGDLYWQVCLYYFGESPEIPIISDLSWYSTFMFLIILLKSELELSGIKKRTPGSAIRRFLPFLPFVYTGISATYFIQYGQIPANILYALFLGYIFYIVLDVLLNYEKPTKRLKAACILAFVFFFAEYGTATSTCFPERPNIYNLYYVFNIIQTLSFPFYFIIPEIGDREVKA